MVIIIGIISGIVTSLGLGGGAILIIGLTLFLGIEQRIAQSVNLIFFIPTANNCKWNKCSNRVKCCNSDRHNDTQKNVWRIFSSNCNIRNIFFNKRREKR